MKYHVERSTNINTDANTVRPIIENFGRWNDWSPWTIVEPECKVTIDGSPGEVGHVMEWDGKIIGSGKLTLEEKTDTELRYNLEFIKPFRSQAKTAFIIKSEGNKTTLTWTLDSSMPFYLFFMVGMMKAWIGMDYDRGLRMLKEIAEKGSVAASTTNAGVTDIPGFSYIGIQRTVSFDEMGTQMQKDFDTLIQEVVVKRNKSAQNWVSLYPRMDMKNARMTYIAAVSDEQMKEELPEGFVRGTIPASRALEIKHNGSYDFIGNAWSMGMMYLRAKKMKQSGIPFEQYWNSPKEVTPEELKTSIYFPLKN